MLFARRDGGSSSSDDGREPQTALAMGPGRRQRRRWLTLLREHQLKIAVRGTLFARQRQPERACQAALQAHPLHTENDT